MYVEKNYRFLSSIKRDARKIKLVLFLCLTVGTWKYCSHQVIYPNIIPTARVTLGQDHCTARA